MHFSRRSIVGRKRNIAGLLAVALACVIGVGAYAFTASNTVAPHSAGAGAATVSGYVVESPDNYTFSGDGLTMVGVKFKLNKPASDVQVALTPGTPETANWSDCGASAAAEEVTCTFATPVPDAEGLKLSVAAVSSGTVTIE
jgi:type 1 fimbria pilin